jgi:hypothetical protein
VAVAIVETLENGNLAILETGLLMQLEMIMVSFIKI